MSNAIQTFDNATMYQRGLGGALYRTDVRRVTVTTGVKDAQYDNAIRVYYLTPRKRKEIGFIMSYKPWLVILSRDNAIEPNAEFLKTLEDTPALFRVTDRDDES